ncbi:sigma-70 family RNA polymerase sigma factor [Mycobacteroides abscessus]|uniref:sigma-70 family RNA polymerase sigma factor n=1 Tax=Mycobacteroides abscessus TaxID=36809 RepID=UPI0009296FE9|nr:sigma-70 family RNA polymerase sigma factor [Mycobacteroides abscessus]MBN7332956.1 sigma-70 family RNA polymerase sigma factor [Mycobacteroides abscessus subsp. abscessus]MDM2401928.1 sigma-70 family RNA polymerase sigma factor [Mycobacteroides abscessus]MDM2412065.1 sigma-70 family RNA polymerase sigma factor [Mycobacteroides abscessus]SHP44176.1 RNA polymerase sigma factor [Mycobacteroides abscessus subsp. abscessus]SIE76615.1 RNA polymerase sigma factor, sigma-70 family [Mycobacteroides
MHLVKQVEIPEDLPDLLTAEQEVELAKRIEAGLYAQFLLGEGGSRYTQAQLRLVAADGRAAFEHFVTANIRLSAWWARKRAAGMDSGALLTVEDLTAEGMLGIIRAVQKFDYTQGFKFSTYALYWVRLRQQRAITGATPAALSSADQERCRGMLAMRYQLETDLGRAPTDAELAAAMGVSVMGVVQMHSMMSRAVSLDAPLFEGGRDESSSLLDVVAGQDSGDRDDAHAMASQQLSDLLALLSDRERRVISDVFGLATGVPRSVNEVADEYRVPVVKVRDLVERAMAKLRGEQQVAA